MSGADHPDQAPRRPPIDHRSVHRKPTARAHPRSGKRSNSLLKITFKARRRFNLCPWHIGAITAAVLVLLHKHERP
jgi:hypothetical protein